MRPRAIRRARSQKLAGVEGFEPPNGGIKTRCLTTWRHPSTRRSYHPHRAHADGRRARILRRLTHPASAGEARGAGSGRGPAPRSSPSDPGPAPRAAPPRRRSRTPSKHATPSPSVAEERRPEGRDLPELEPAVPELVQHEARRGRIRAPVAEARSQGDALANSKAGTEPRAGSVLQSAGGPHREIGLGCEVLRALRPLDPPVVPHADLERVGEIDELKEGLQLVIAVGAPARHMEKEIQLGGRGPARVAAGLHGCQSSTRSRTRTASRLSVNRAGSISAPTAT